MQRAVVNGGERLDRFAQAEAPDDGSGLEGARFETWRELLHDFRTGNGVIGAAVHAKQTEPAMIKVE